MKAFFLTGSIVFTVLILILAFENMGVACSGFLLLFMPMESGFLVTLALAFVGVVTGLFYAGFISQVLHSREEEQESPGGEW
jgi:hypothetical protein